MFTLQALSPYAGGLQKGGGKKGSFFLPEKKVIDYAKKKGLFLGRFRFVKLTFSSHNIDDDTA